jgi:MoaA/NifB/PqqE/SkfB family radical SAM enzyme
MEYMTSFSDSVKAFGVKQVLGYLQKDPEKNIPKILDWLEKYGGDVAMPKQLAFVRRVLSDPNGKWYKYAVTLFKEINPNCLDKFLTNFVINASLLGLPRERKMAAKYKCNIPWLILFDPTSACNLHCVGCWAAEYGYKNNLSLEDMDKIVSQGKELGVYYYLLTGGEPTVRMDDVLKLAAKHNDCAFQLFTNTTLLTDEVLDKVVEVGNIAFAPSIEGTRETTDARRGEGTYDKVMDCLDRMHKKGIIYFASICYTHANYKAVTSDEFINTLVDKGVRIAWYFHYMPVGNDATPDLLLTPDEREYVYKRVRYIRSEKSPFPMFTIDFQNDGEYVGGCIAGGKNYCHINSAGDVEPCVFIHYSSANIHDQDLLDCLRQPLFMKYREMQPFSQNMLMPCPMLENSGVLTEMVNETGAHSTDLTSPESAEHLCGKTKAYADNWAPRAEELWDERKKEKAKTKAADEAAALAKPGSPAA